ncbi:MAG: 2-hydroxyglutaryl-CoA dehydratase [Bacillota bacterium]|nr:2-hydroxyglutaryl-CoA dehydratase [Bacillota bacterium]
MKVTFPHFGTVGLVIPKLLTALHVPMVVPPANDSEILKKGAEYAPEEMCIPFKYMVGNFLCAHEKGADTGIMAATAGPCRLGEYGQLLTEVLANAGCGYDWILLDTPSAIGAKEFFRRLGSVFEGKAPGAGEILRAVGRCLLLVKKIDRLEGKLLKQAGYLKEPYRAVKLLRDTEEELEAAGTFEDCFRIIGNGWKQMERLERKEQADPIKVLITGEIYTCMEREANGYLEEKLMKAGCSIKRQMTLSWWIGNTVIRAIVPERTARNTGREKGLACGVGGYGRESVSEIINGKGFDGIIKIMPSGCMPEIVTKSFCENLKTKDDLRILHLIYDEMCGQAGYETRVEAFIDMLERRKNVLAGNRHRLHKHGFGGAQ